MKYVFSLRSVQTVVILFSSGHEQLKDVYMVALRGPGGAPLFSRMVV